MKEIALEIEGIKVFTPRVFNDDRGYLFESFRSSWLPGVEFVQDNHSHSTKGALRGLHYQHRRPQGSWLEWLEARFLMSPLISERHHQHSVNGLGAS